MAFNLTIETDSGFTCDKCKKPASPEKPVVDMQVTGRSYNDRQIISIHKACLEKAISKGS